VLCRISHTRVLKSARLFGTWPTNPLPSTNKSLLITALETRDHMGEADVLSYERFVSVDGTVAHVYERYADSAAAVRHLRTFKRKCNERFVGMVDRERFTVFGVTSDELKGMLNGFGPISRAAAAGITPSSACACASAASTSSQDWKRAVSMKSARPPGFSIRSESAPRA